MKIHVIECNLSLVVYIMYELSNSHAQSMYLTQSSWKGKTVDRFLALRLLWKLSKPVNFLSIYGFCSPRSR